MYMFLDGHQEGEQNKHLIHNFILRKFLKAVFNM